jgi:uncharacterized protein
MTEHPEGPAPVPVAPAAAPLVREPFFRRLGPVAFVILTLIGIFILYQIIGGGVMLLVVGLDLEKGSVDLIRWSTLLGQLVFLLVPTLILTRLRFGKIIAPLRFHKVDLVQLIVVIGATLALQQVLQGYQLMQDAIPLPAALERILIPIKNAMEGMLRMLLISHSTGEFLLVLATVAVMPAIAEEILFRGLIQSDLERTISGPKAAIITGVTFSLFHLNPFLLIPIIAIGVVFGWIVYRSGNIVLTIVAHFVNNALAAVAMRFGLPDDFLFIAPQGGGDAMTIALNTLVGAVVFVALMWYFMRITKKPVHA